MVVEEQQVEQVEEQEVAGGAGQAVEAEEVVVVAGGYHRSDASTTGSLEFLGQPYHHHRSCLSTSVSITEPHFVAVVFTRRVTARNK